MSGAKLLPEGFQSLAPFVDSWAVATSAERAQRRNDSTETERLTFFYAMKDVLPNALALLDAKPLDQFDENEERLMRLALSFAHVALAVEVQADDEPRHAQSRQYLKITQAPSDHRAA